MVVREARNEKDGSGFEVVDKNILLLHRVLHFGHSGHGPLNDTADVGEQEQVVLNDVGASEDAYCYPQRDTPACCSHLPLVLFPLSLLPSCHCSCEFLVLIVKLYTSDIAALYVRHWC